MSDKIRKQFNIPDDWTISKIGTIFDIKQGKSLSHQKQKGKLCRRFLRTSNVFWGRLDLSTIDEMNFTDDECKKLELQYGDLLVCEGGDIGRTAIWRNELSDCYYQNHLHRLRNIDNSVNPFYVMFWLQAGMTQLGIYEGIGNKTTIPNLSRSRLSEFDIFLPPLPEQEKIAAVLHKIQKAIEVQEKIIESTKELKKTLMQHLFTKGTRGEKTKQTEIGEIPESWEVLKLKNCAEKFHGGGTPKTNNSAYWTGDIKWTTTAIINEEDIYIDGYQKMISEEGLNNSSSQLVRAGNLLIGTRVGVGKAVINKKDIAISQDFTAAILKKDIISPEFLAYSFKLQKIQDWFERNKRGATIKGVPREDLLELQFPYPPYSEQQKIVEILLTIDNKNQLATSKRHTLQSLFKSTLNKLMIGEIRVKDLKIDVSEIKAKESA